MKNEEIAVIIPTYNESGNIETLIKQIHKNLSGSQVIVVDDSNQKENEKIGEIARRTKTKLITREQKLGRGSAVITGFREALKDKKIKLLFEMDADLSHDPGELNLFLSKMEQEKVDLIVGSRYLKQSQIIDWPLWRLIMSKFINLFLNSLLGLMLTDYTNGYRLYNRKAADFLVDTKFKTSGFILLSESSYKLKNGGFKIAEVPVHFIDRKYGESSMGLKELFASLYGILKVRFTK